jgi:hypothetical protein
MTTKSREQKRARTLQTRTGWKYQECLQQVRKLDDTAIDLLVQIRAEVSPIPPPGDVVVMNLTQPFTGSQVVILEKRTSDGALDFSGEQAPTAPMTFDALYRLYFRANPSVESGTWDGLKAWLDSKGWRVRAKTW